MDSIKIDLKKEYKPFYKATPGSAEFINVPEFQYLMIDGNGDPANKLFQECIQALYSVAYKLKFISKEIGKDFVVMPLEGLWWAKNLDAYIQNKRENWLWTLMVMQPDWITQEYMDEAISFVEKKKGPGRLKFLRLEILNEGCSAQILHIGSYTKEHPTIIKLHKAIKINGQFDGQTQKHHEIYLNDPRKVAEKKLKTIIRQPYTVN